MEHVEFERNHTELNTRVQVRTEPKKISTKQINHVSNRIKPDSTKPVRSELKQIWIYQIQTEHTLNWNEMRQYETHSDWTKGLWI